MSQRIKTALLLISCIIAGVSGWRMWNLFQNDMLWGYLPLVFFISIWSFILILLTRKSVNNPKKARRVSLSILSGLLLAFSFPNTLPDFIVGKTMLVFVGFVPLLLIEHGLKDELKAGRQMMFYAFNAFVIWNMLATYWVANTAFAAGIVAIWLNSFFMSVPIWLFHKTKKFVPRLGYVSLVAYWISFEHLHLNWEISWSWLNLGNTFAEVPKWIQWYEYTGTFGGTLWVLLANILIFKILEPNTSGSEEVMKQKQKYRIGVGALVLLPMIISAVMYGSYEQKGKPVEVVVVQPNFEPHYEKFTINKDIQLRKFMRLADSAITDQTRYLVFPETSFGLVEISDYSKSRYLNTLNGFLKKYPKVNLITGVDAYRIFSKEEADTPHTRTRTQDGMRYEMYNGALQLKAGKEMPDFYKKSKFVPGAEIFPYSDALFFFEPLVSYLGGSVKGLGGQPKRSCFEDAGMKVAPSICYESIFGSYNNGYIKQGAQATFIMTNDGWWDNTAGHRQHLKLGRLRAIETRRDIARSANTGISGFINQRGDISQPTDYGVPATVKGNVFLNTDITFYVIWGDLIARLALFTTMILLANLFVKSRMKKESK